MRDVFDIKQKESKGLGTYANLDTIGRVKRLESAHYHLDIQQAQGPRKVTDVGRKTDEDNMSDSFLDSRNMILMRC